MAAMNTSDYQVRYRTVKVDGVNVFYREAGDSKTPALMLLHGFPTSSHMFRDLIPLLRDRYHVVAPDLPGFGFSDAPDRAQFKYTFEHLAEVIERFTEVVRFAALCALYLRLWRPCGPPPRTETSRTRNCDRLPERQCL